MGVIGLSYDVFSKRSQMEIARSFWPKRDVGRSTTVIR